MTWSEIKTKARPHWGPNRGPNRGPVAFVLSGGGPLGAIQAGWLKALFQAGIRPGIMIGTSVGALNACVIASDPTVEGAEKLSGQWREMRRDELFPGGRISSAWNVLKRGSYVYENAGLRRFIKQNLEGVCRFEDLKVPLHVNATELHTGQDHWFTSGRLLEPLLASAAMPGVFPPVSIDGAMYIDGGVANNVAVTRAIESGARTVYVLNVNAASQKRDLHRPHDFMMHSFVISRSQRYRSEIEDCRRRARVIEMPVPEVGHVPFTDLRHTERLIQAGYSSGCEAVGLPTPGLQDEAV